MKLNIFKAYLLIFKNTYLLFLALLFLWVSLIAWALSSPIGASPDEDFHQTHIYCANKDYDQCFLEGSRYGHCFTMRPNVSASCFNYSKLSAPMATKVDWDHYPALYFKLMTNFVGENLSSTTIRVRLINSTIAVIFLLGSVMFSQSNLRAAVVLSWVVGSMPLGMYFMSSINPTAWITISIAAIWGPILTQLNKGFFNCIKFTRVNSIINMNVNWLSSFRIIFIFLAILLGIGSRTESIIWLPLTVVIILIFWLLGQSFERKIILSKSIFVSLFIISIIFIVLIGFIDFFRNKVFILINNLDLLKETYLSKISWSMLQNTFNILVGITELPGIPQSGLGTHDVPVPAMAIIFTGFSLGSCFLFALSKPSLRKLLVLAGLVILLVIITSFLWSLHDWDYLQPRYFLPMVYVILGIALIPDRNRLAGNKGQWASILVGLSLANCIILLSTLLRFMHGVVYQNSRFPLTKNAPDINPNRLFTDEMPNWWWIDFSLSPATVWVLGSICFGVSMLFLWMWLLKSRSFSYYSRS